MNYINTGNDTRIDGVETISNHTKYIFAKATLGAIAHPLTFTKTLYQLGFDLQNLSVKSAHLIPRRKAPSLITSLRLLNNVHSHFGLRNMYRGATAGFLGSLTGGFTSKIVEEYLDAFFVDVGGNVVDVGGNLNDISDMDLTFHQSFRVHLRHAIRRSIISTIGVIVSHPFAVLLVRQIMKVAQNENDYTNVLYDFLHLGDEEGLPGLFSGLVPSLIANIVCVWTLFGCAFLINRFLVNVEKNCANMDDKHAVRELRQFVSYVPPFIANASAYAFEVDATVASVKQPNL